MANNNRYPGIKLESAANVADLPPIQPPPIRTNAQPEYRPRARRERKQTAHPGYYQNTQPATQNEETAQRPAQLPALPFAWIFKPIGKKRRLSPARRAVLMLIGCALLAFSGYLSMLAMQNYIPAFRTSAHLSQGAIVAGLACTAIFGGIEVLIFRMFGFTYRAIGIALGAYVVDCWINIDGVVYLFQLGSLWGHDLGTAIALVVGIGSAALPEIFIDAGLGEE